MAKRSRSENFSPEEAMLLVDICIKHANVIENKNSDAITNKDKAKEWEIISEQFNAEGLKNTYRDAKTLRLKYDCIKRDIKTKKAKNKAEVYKTGGGVPKAQELNGYETKLYPFIALSVCGLQSNFDSDTQPGNC